MEPKNCVLIIDDSFFNIHILDKVLHDDYDIMKAMSANEALSLLETQIPDLILLDVVLPDMDGFALIQIIKADSRLEKIPVIFVTGSSEMKSERMGLELGAIDYVKKPFDSFIVKTKVKNQLELKKYRHDLELQVEQRTRELIAAEEGIIMSLAMLAEKRDENTGRHLLRLKHNVAIIALYLHKKHPELVAREDVELFSVLSPVHDIGKVAISDDILLKPAPLTAAEFEKIKKHTLYGADVLREASLFMRADLKALRIATEICEGHHEKYDGSGYPYGLVGNQIPLSARITAVADVYDALIDARPYKRTFTHKEAVHIITKGDGRTIPQHFDPLVLEAFCETIGKK